MTKPPATGGLFYGPPMTSINIHRQAKEATVSIVVTRANGTVENLGVVSYWHRNPLKRLWWKIKHPKQMFKGFKTRKAQAHG